MRFLKITDKNEERIFLNNRLVWFFEKLIKQKMWDSFLSSFFR